MSLLYFHQSMTCWYCSSQSWHTDMNLNLSTGWYAEYHIWPLYLSSYDDVITMRYIYISMSVTRSAPGATRGASTCSRWRPTSYMDAAFVFLAHEGAEIWTNWSLLFTQAGLLQLQRNLSLCSLCFSWDLTAGDRRYADPLRVIRTWVSSTSALP